MNNVLNLVIIVLIFCFSNHTNAQEYSPFAVEGATWAIYTDNDDPNEHWGYRIAGDTIVDDIQYKKFYYLGIYRYVDQGYDDLLLFSRELFALVRDDIVKKKVFIRPLKFDIPGGEVSYKCQYLPWIKDHEVELFDFNLTIGDAFDGCMLDHSWDVQMDTIRHDTIVNIFGANRQVWSIHDVSSSIDKPFFIEGVGYSDGLFNNISQYVGYKDYIFDYCVGSEWDCKLLTAASDVPSENKMILFPNPTDQFLYFEGLDASAKIKIFDVSGRKTDQVILAPNTNRHDVSRLQSGIYFIEIISKDSKIKKKFVKL